MKQSPLTRLIIPIISVAAGTGMAVAVFGTSSQERRQLEALAAEYAAIPTEQQRVVRLSYDDLKSQSTERQAQIRSLFEASSTDPKLEQTVGRFYDWWTSVPRETAEEFHSRSNPDRLRLVTEQWSQKAPGVPKETIVVNFARTPASRLPELHLSDNEYWQMISSVITDDERPESLRTELGKLSDDRQRALRLSLWVFETLADPKEREQGALIKAANRTRRLKEQLLSTVSDEKWKQAFRDIYKGVEGKPWEQNFLAPTAYVILSQAAMSLGNRLQESFPVSEDQLIAAFDSITERQQKQEIMALPPAQAKARLEFIAQSQLGESPEKDLLVKFSEFARRHDQLVRAASWGLGGFGRNGRNGGPQGSPPSLPPDR
jgi:hypothetical protein